MKNFHFSFFLQVILSIIAICFAFYCGWIANDAYEAILKAGNAIEENLNNFNIRVSSEEEKVATDIVSEVSANTSDPDFRVVETTEQIKAYIIEVSEQYGIDSELPLKIAECESNFRNICCYLGCKFGQGIYQFEPITWAEQCEGEIDNPKDNIDCAIKLLSRDEKWRWNNSRSEWEK